MKHLFVALALAVMASACSGGESVTGPSTGPSGLADPSTITVRIAHVKPDGQVLPVVEGETIKLKKGESVSASISVNLDIPMNKIVNVVAVLGERTDFGSGQGGFMGGEYGASFVNHRPFTLTLFTQDDRISCFRWRYVLVAVTELLPGNLRGPFPPAGTLMPPQVVAAPFDSWGCNN